jgi:hypothetical protein
MHAHLSHQRQAEYAPGLAARGQATKYALPSRMLPVKTRASRIGNPAGQFIPARPEKYLTMPFHCIMPITYTATSNTG